MCTGYFPAAIGHVASASDSHSSRSEWQIRPILIVDVEFSGQGKGKAVQAIHQ